MSAKTSVVNALAEYKELATKHLFQPSQIERFEIKDMYGGIDIHFMFPNLSERDRAVLCKFARYRLAVSRQLRMDLKTLSTEMRTRVEAICQPMNIEYVALRKRVEALKPKLTTIQEEIVSKLLQAPLVD